MNTTDRETAIDAAGRDLAALLQTRAAMTPRELAEASWTPTSPYSVDELEDQIRAERGIEARARSA